MKKVSLSEVRDDLPKYLRIAESEDVLITEDGKPAGMLIGFRTEDDWLEYQLESDPRFLKRIDEARHELRHGQGVRLEDLED